MREIIKYESPIDIAEADAVKAYARLLHFAETRKGGQARRVVALLASMYDAEAFPFDMGALRSVDVNISFDMLACIDAFRWPIADLHTLVPDGAKRVLQVIRDWGLKWPEPDVPVPAPSPVPAIKRRRVRQRDCVAVVFATRRRTNSVVALVRFSKML